jgi:chloramphenicol O-acetyltransferase type A
MRTIDLSTWHRREQFLKFISFSYPHFNLCANLDLSAFLPAIKARDVSPTVAIVYLIARVANELPEFRWRIHGEQVVEHEVVHPSTTILTPDDLFSFCLVPYTPDFPAFAEDARQRFALVKAHPTLQDEPGQDNLLFMTSIPWVSFTSFMHPIHLQPIDSVPRFAWGKFFAEGERVKMPLSVQVHHALMDGLHVGRYYEMIQGYFDDPRWLDPIRPRVF